MAVRLSRSVGLAALGTALVSAAVVMGCASQSDLERQRDAAVAEEEEVRRSPVDGLPRAAPISVADRARWQPILQWPQSCEDAFRTSHAGDDGGLAFRTLRDGLSTVEVLCASGSYQPSHVFLRFDERGSSLVSTLLQFATYQSEDGQRIARHLESELFGEVAFSADGRELSVLSLARQLGDCGVWTRYAIDIDTGRPTVVAAATRLPCPATPGEPVEWQEGAAPPGWIPLSIQE